MTLSNYDVNENSQLRISKILSWCANLYHEVYWMNLSFNHRFWKYFNEENGHILFEENNIFFKIAFQFFVNLKNHKLRFCSRARIKT